MRRKVIITTIIFSILTGSSLLQLTTLSILIVGMSIALQHNPYNCKSYRILTATRSKHLYFKKYILSLNVTKFKTPPHIRKRFPQIYQQLLKIKLLQSLEYLIIIQKFCSHSNINYIYFLF